MNGEGSDVGRLAGLVLEPAGEMGPRGRLGVPLPRDTAAGPTGITPSGGDLGRHEIIVVEPMAKPVVAGRVDQQVEPQLRLRVNLLRACRLTHWRVMSVGEYTSSVRSALATPAAAEDR